METRISLSGLPDIILNFEGRNLSKIFKTQSLQKRWFQKPLNLLKKSYKGILLL